MNQTFIRDQSNLIPNNQQNMKYYTNKKCLHIICSYYPTTPIKGAALNS